MKYPKQFLLASICLFLLCNSGIAGETWVLLGSGIEPQLLNAPKGSKAKNLGIAGFGWLVDLQSIVKQGNLVFYHERGTMIDKDGNSIKDMESSSIYLRIVDCNTRLMKFREQSEWKHPTPEHQAIVNYLCPERQIKKEKGDII